jgi:hypothetical protein
MAAFTGSPHESVGYLKQASSGPKIQAAAGLSMVKLPLYTHLAAQGAGTGTIYLGYLPAGDYWVFPQLSTLVSSAWATNADAHIGFPAFTKIDGTTETADDNRFFDNVDVATGGNFAGSLAPFHVQAAAPVRIDCMVDTGNIETDDTLEVHLCISTPGLGSSA